MTSRERLLCAMRGGTPDRTPVAPWGMGRIDPGTDLGQELIARTDILLDVGSGGDPFLGSGVSVQYDDSGDRLEIIYETPKGPIRQVIRRTAITSATVEFPFKTPEDIERFFSIPYAPPSIDLTGFFAWKERMGEEGLIMVGIGNAVCLPATWFSPEDFCLAWAEAPDLLVRLTALASERLLAYAERLCQAGADAFRIIGGEYVSVQLGPKAFRRLIVPFDSALADLMHRYGAVAHYHNHGKVKNYMSDLAELGIDSLDPLEAPPWGDASLKDARDRAGERLCFVGNLDDMEIIDALPENEVLAIARERLDSVSPKAFILGGTASGTYGERGARNFIAMAEMASRR